VSCQFNFVTLLLPSKLSIMWWLGSCRRGGINDDHDNGEHGYNGLGRIFTDATKEE